MSNHRASGHGISGEFTDRQLASACILGSFDGTTAPRWLLDRIRDGLGGVVLFAQNVADDDQVAELCALFRSAREDVVIAIDEEGGDVTRLDATTGCDIPSPAAFGAVDEPDMTRAAFGTLGDRLSRLGIDLTLAPCADINSDPRNPIVGVRAFGATADVVARHVAASIAGLHEGGALACVKHYPGHGDTTADTHLGPARVSGSLAELGNRELIPFVAAIAAGTDAVLTAHLVADALDDAPVSISAAWMGHLRGSMGFAGVIITDALDMGAVAGDRGIDGVADAAVAALHAGADLLCLGADFTDGAIERAVEAICVALAEARLDRQALVTSRRRNLAMHSRPRRSGAITAGDGVDAARRVARAAIDVDGRLPRGPFVVIECRPPANLPSSNVRWGLADSFAELGWQTHVVGPADHERDINTWASDPAAPLLVVVRDADVHPWQIRLVERCAAVAAELVVVELGWPAAQRPPASSYIVTHGACRASSRAVVELITASCRKEL